MSSRRPYCAGSREKERKPSFRGVFGECVVRVNPWVQSPACFRVEFADREVRVGSWVGTRQHAGVG